jgi:hypothetical protein
MKSISLAFLYVLIFLKLLQGGDFNFGLMAAPHLVGFTRLIFWKLPPHEVIQ